MLRLSSSSAILVIGIAPSLRVKNNKTLARLGLWLNQAGIDTVDFCNVFPEHCEHPKIKNCDLERLRGVVHGRKVVALGSFVSRVCNKLGLQHLRVEHPSGRNRKLNDPEKHQEMVRLLMEYSREPERA